MRWPWEYLMKFKGTDKGVATDVIDPAEKELERSKERLQRVNRILAEADIAQATLKTMRGNK